VTYKRKEVIGNATLSGIYAITNAVNGKRYIGSAVNLRARRNQHRFDLRRGRHKSPKLQAAWNKYGETAFGFSVLELVPDKSKLIEREQAWIDAERVCVMGYNTRPVAGNQLGFKHSEASLKKMRESQSKRVRQPCAEETKEKIRAAQIGRPKPPCSPEYRAVMSVLMKGRKKPPRTPEQRARAALIQTGKKASAATRMAMSLAQSARWERARSNGV
jgi:group I intron endonuclease